MANIVIIDTSVLLNLLDVPGRNRESEQVAAQFREFSTQNARFLLPFAVIIETAGFIKRVRDTGQRREVAKRFTCAITAPSRNSEHFIGSTSYPDQDDFEKWIKDFPDYAARDIDLTDLLIIRIWENAKNVAPDDRVQIWSLDQDLTGYDYNPVPR